MGGRVAAGGPSESAAEMGLSLALAVQLSHTSGPLPKLGLGFGFRV